MAGEFTTDMGVLAGIQELNNRFEWYYGDVEPVNPRPFLNWGHLSEDLWKQRNVENTEWIIRGNLSQSYFGLMQQSMIDIIDPLGVPKPYFGTVLPEFYLWCDGKTIGDALSGATARANADVHDLFVVLWSATGLKIYESTGALSARGADAEADWAAHKRLELPNMTDNFLRGPQQGRDIGSTQGDAIRNITGTFVTSGEEYSGAFYKIGSANGATLSGTDILLGFDASRVVPTADENRPKNISCNWILRY